MIHLKQIILNINSNDNENSSLKEANEIVSLLDNGGDINHLANTYGDKKYNRENGDWGWVKRDELRAELSEIAFNLKPGEYTKPIKLDNFIFILYAENIQEEKIQPVIEVRETI